MRQVVSLSLLLAVFIEPGSPAKAQISIESQPIRVITACFNAAISVNNIKKRGTKVMFICYGQVAQQFYQKLNGHETSDVKLSSGFSARRRFIYYNDNDNVCFNHYQDNNGNSVNTFRCQMAYDAGDFINE